MSKYRPAHMDEEGSRAYRSRTTKRGRKIARTIFEAVVVLAGIALILWAIFAAPEYEPVTAAGTEDHGFIALSYFGVEKLESDSESLIYQERLQEHIDALSKSGYVTISQQDILDYYAGEKLLPEKALFLMLEDGRKDTSIFASDIFEKYNYLSTVLTYADKFEKRDPKFLAAADVRSLMKSSFFEVGTNGYRLEYINVFDRYGNYFGAMNSNEFVTINQYLLRDYNHYLMDYIRDEDRLRTETYEEMRERVTTDYESLKYVYENQLGFVPELYVIMHANTGMFATDPEVSAVNRENLEAIFGMNFNREGYSLNTTESSIYDLTRMEPQANWYANHLLMRIWDDTKQEMAFVTGDEEEAANWNALTGVAEYKGDKIVLTSEPHGYGRLALKNESFTDFELTASLDGNRAGNQGLYLRASETLDSGIYVGLENNALIIRELSGGGSRELVDLDLFTFDGWPYQSVEENENEGLIAAQNAFLKYDDDYDTLQKAQGDLEKYESRDVATLDEGGEGYIPSEIDLTEKASRKLRIVLKGSELTVYIDGRAAVEGLEVTVNEGGTLGLESSALIENKYNQRNTTDDVYDAVFTELRLKAIDDDATMYYSYEYEGFEKVWNTAKKVFNQIANFFIENF